MDSLRIDQIVYIKEYDCVWDLIHGSDINGDPETLPEDFIEWMEHINDFETLSFILVQTKDRQSLVFTTDMGDVVSCQTIDEFYADTLAAYKEDEGQ